MFINVYDETTNTTTMIPITEPMEDDLEYFFDDEIRKVWHRQEEEWYFSIVDVCAVLTSQPTARGASTYWAVLKQRLEKEGFSELLTDCKQLKLKATDGKMRKTDCVNTRQLLRIIQSIPSKKAEPFKQWLAYIGKERLDEIADPELAFERMVQTYRKKGYSEKWIEQRLHAIDIRKTLTDEWNRAGIKESRQYASLTNILTHAWSGKTVKEYKQYKGLHKENLRDNMTNIELALNQLAEVSATALSKAKNPNGFEETKETVIDGGNIAGNARKELEKKLGSTVISTYNANKPELLDVSDDATSF